MTIAQISAWIMLVSCGLWAGGILIFAVERTNLWRRMPIDQYAVDFRRSLFRVDPMMPILGVIAGVAATIFALKHSGAPGTSRGPGLDLLCSWWWRPLLSPSRSTPSSVGCPRGRRRNGPNTIGPFGGAFMR
jgi:hypothetical protein